jgi:hypothetical protein
MSVYRVYCAEGDELGEATYAQRIKNGRNGLALRRSSRPGARRSRDTSDDSDQYAGLLRVEST